jgi:hypothetical protein
MVIIIDENHSLQLNLTTFMMNELFQRFLFLLYSALPLLSSFNISMTQQQFALFHSFSSISNSCFLKLYCVSPQSAHYDVGVPSSIFSNQHFQIMSA